MTTLTIYECPECGRVFDSAVLCPGRRNNRHERPHWPKAVPVRVFREEAFRNLREGLRLIASEARQFPDEDGIGAGTMAENILKAADRMEAETHAH